MKIYHIIVLSNMDYRKKHGVPRSLFLHTNFGSHCWIPEGKSILISLVSSRRLIRFRKGRFFGTLNNGRRRQILSWIFDLIQDESMLVSVNEAFS